MPTAPMYFQHEIDKNVFFFLFYPKALKLKKQQKAKSQPAQKKEAKILRQLSRAPHPLHHLIVDTSLNPRLPPLLLSKSPQE